jgi:23S rRNA (cytidine1920-2'-O)/16S rRNA (cytidine1409-2'-O)-methyltransferase
LKERLDKLLIERGLFSTREKAKRAILAGLVKVENKYLDKPGTRVENNAQIETKEGIPYVSRGGLKLEKALKEFRIKVENKVVLDVGASTGGFTDCLLQRGAKRVYALDVGYGQLDWKLRNAPRVINIERTNIRYFKEKDLPEKADLVTVDVSFISLDKVLPSLIPLLREKGEIIVLIKPQFEAERKQTKKGVVRDPQVHKEVIYKIIAVVGKENLKIRGLTFSPLRGPAGNIEYFIYLSKGGKGMRDTESRVKEIIEEAWRGDKE